MCKKKVEKNMNKNPLGKIETIINNYYTLLPLI